MPLSISYRPYVLEMPAEDDFDGTALSLCLVVIKRDNGMILAVPQSFIPDDVLESAMQAGTEEVLGPSTQRRLPASRLAGFDGGGAPPLPMEAEVDVTLIDVLPEFADGLRTVDPSMPNWELVHTFHQEHPTMFPFRDALVAAAWEWIGNVGADSRVHFYLAVEDEVVPECPVEEDEEADAEVPDPVGPALNGPSSTAKGKSKAAKPVVPKAKKQTVASLASTLDGLAQALPALTAQMSELASRTQKMEEAMAGGQRSSALKQPLGSLTTGGSAQPSLPISSLLHEMPAPRLVRPKVLQLAPPPGPHQNLEQRWVPQPT